MALTTADGDLVGTIDELTAPGKAAFRRGLVRVSANLVPNPPIRAVDWIEDTLVIPNGSRPGPVKLDIVQREVLDALQEQGVHTVVWLKPPRAGSSTMTALMLIFEAAYEANDTIFYERNDSEAQNFHDKKLRPILEASTKIAHLLRPDTRSGIQDSWSDIYLTNGAALQQRGAQADGNFKSIRARLVAIDEAGDPAFNSGGAGSEGSKVGQARTRTAEYPDGRLYVAGTPTTPNCTVVSEHKKGDQRRLMMPFPCCSHVQEFLPRVSEAGSRTEIPGPGLKFRCDDAGDVVEVGYECSNPSCRAWLREDQRNAAMEAGRFVSRKPRPEVPGTVSLETWAIHAKDPGLSWSNIVAKYRAQLADPAQAQDWQNLWLAQPYTPASAGQQDPDLLEERCEEYEAPCPAEVVEIFAGIDTQKGSERRGQLPRHEIVTIGVGPNEEKWVLGREIIDRVYIEVVDPETGEVTQDWERIDPFGPEAARLIWEALDRGWTKPDGSILHASRVGLDVGYETNKALNFAAMADSKRRKIVPLKGRNEAPSPVGKRAPAITSSPHRLKRGGFGLWLLGTYGLKDYILQCLDVQPGEPYSFHFPMDLVGTDFFTQLTCEELIFSKNNSELCKWDKPSRRQHDSNEVHDCLVMALGAMHFQKARSARTRRALAMDPNAARLRRVGLNRPAAKPDSDIGTDRSATPPAVETDVSMAEKSDAVKTARPRKKASSPVRAREKAPVPAPAVPAPAAPSPQPEMKKPRVWFAPARRGW